MAKRSQRAQRSHHRKLELEALENRRVPSCTVFQRGATLYVLGDRFDNRVMITETGDNAVHVECDADRPADFTGVNKIILQTGAGQDYVSLKAAPDSTAPIALDADLGLSDDEADLTCSGPAKISFGNGDDVGIIVVDGRPGTAGPGLDLNWGAGDDAGIIIINSLPAGTANVRGGDGADEVGIIVVDGVPAGASQKVNVYGDRGDDHTEVEVGGPVAGLLGIEYHGGDGADDAGIIVIDGLPVSGSLEVNFHGDRGDDKLHLEADDLAVAGRFSSNFLGGAGHDDLAATMAHATVAAGAALTCRLDGSSGNDDLRADVAGIDFTPGTAPMGTAEFDFRGGAGNDTESAAFDNPILHKLFNPQPEPPARVLVNMSGDAGQDYINFLATGELDGELMLTCNGGSYSDTIQTLLDVDPRGRSTVNALLLGGLGQDYLTGLAFGGRSLAFLVDGFAGFDTAHITRNVATRGVEEVFFVE
jgi:hypothetical protein